MSISSTVQHSKEERYKQTLEYCGTNARVKKLFRTALVNFGRSESNLFQFFVTPVIKASTNPWHLIVEWWERLTQCQSTVRLHTLAATRKPRRCCAAFVRLSWDHSQPDRWVIKLKD